MLIVFSTDEAVLYSGDLFFHCNALPKQPLPPLFFFSLLAMVLLVCSTVEEGEDLFLIIPPETIPSYGKPDFG